ncbi:hypothetical protein JGH11_09285 [Dysgonomonas sp. Marseille-P4677]|uniref:hypothetical protein n=1 Tax=Dysgonomonas sp. Marseille-P4677 TaxID=2364790 RepID=UPI001911C60B|nr:hypothetical protein [Dysgonomonas sp. Marseille-P4677]MBK5721060.1 hypothetical protein [Dysgonomonas sp. Marseille-P4677]
MKLQVFILNIILVAISLSACSSLESDAKKAAELEKKSIEYIKEGDLEEAERVFKEAKEIITQYKGTEKYERFYEVYNNHIIGKATQN